MNLHSTMLLLYHMTAASRGNVPQIYIPLCFYFISKKISTKYDVMFYLHSTMLLLYPSSSCCSMSLVNIYIPLCFYFIQALQVAVFPGKFIYIPLCFYFISADVQSGPLTVYLHSTMLLLYPVPVFPFYFLQYKYTFCLPHFLHISLLKNLPPPTLQNLNFP